MIIIIITKMEDRGGRKGTGAWEPCSWHQAWPLGPRYCCCYELGGGSSCPVGASPHLGRGPFFWDVLWTALLSLPSGASCARQEAGAVLPPCLLPQRRCNRPSLPACRHRVAIWACLAAAEQRPPGPCSSRPCHPCRP